MANATPAQFKAWDEKYRDARLARLFQIIKLGPSPKEQIVNKITNTADFKLVNTEVVPMPTVDPTRQ